VAGVSAARGEAGFEVDVKPIDRLTASVFAPDGLFLISSSTYGQGDVPDNATNLYNELSAKMPDLKNAAATRSMSSREISKLGREPGRHPCNLLSLRGSVAGRLFAAGLPSVKETNAKCACDAAWQYRQQ